MSEYEISFRNQQMKAHHTANFYHFFVRRSCYAYIAAAIVEISYALFLLIKSKSLNDESELKPMKDPKDVERALKVAQKRTAEWVNDSSNSTSSATPATTTNCPPLISSACKTGTENEVATINGSTQDIESLSNLLNPPPKKIYLPKREEHPFYNVEVVSYDDYMNGLMWQIKRLIVNIIHLILTGIFLPGIKEDDLFRTLTFCVGNTGMILLNFVLTALLLQYCTSPKNCVIDIINSVVSLGITIYLTVIGYIFLNHVTHM